MEQSLQILNVSGNLLTGLGGIETCSNLRFLNMSKNKVRSVRGINMLGYLTELFIQNNNIQEIDSVSLLLNIRILDVSDNLIVDLSKLAVLSKCESLEVASFKGNQCTDHQSYQIVIKKAIAFSVAIDPKDAFEYSDYKSYKNICISQNKADVSA